jgi:hypothetical protein
VEEAATLDTLAAVLRGCDTAFRADQATSKRTLTEQATLSLAFAYEQDQAVLRSGPYWFLTADTLTLLEQAVPSMPEQCLYPSTPMEPSGAALLERRVARPDASVGFDLLIWRTVLTPEHPRFDAILMVSMWGEYGRIWLRHGGYGWIYGQFPSAPADIVQSDAGPERKVWTCQWLSALWNLSASPGVLAQTPGIVSNAQRKRAERRGSDTAYRRLSVRTTGPRDNSSHSGNVDWSHRWIVRPHWRQQACGPGRLERRSIWIQAHVKGPEDKPLDLRPGVRVV